MCVRTIFVRNPKYKKNKKNGGRVPKCKDERLLLVPVSCGTCFECRRKKASEWRVRLAEEIKEYPKCYFITLTFSNESIENIKQELEQKEEPTENNDIATYAIRHFLENVRAAVGKSVRHWLITELSDEGRIHLHGIWWGKEELLKYWKYGFYHVGEYVNEKTINYIIKYVTKINFFDKTFRGKILASSGIGKCFFKHERRYECNFYRTDKETNQNYRLPNGRKIRLPQYYRQVLYTEEEREKLWIEAQEKEYRYVDGEKIDMNDPWAYLKAMEAAQEKDKRISRMEQKQWDAEKEKRKLQRMIIARKKCGKRCGKNVEKE